MKCKMSISWGRKERRISLSISQALSHFPFVLSIFFVRTSCLEETLFSWLQISHLNHPTRNIYMYIISRHPKKGGHECPSIGGGVNELKGSHVVQTETIWLTHRQTRWLACFSSVIHTLSPRVHMLVEPVHFELGPNYRTVIVQRTKNMINRRAGHREKHS